MSFVTEPSGLKQIFFCCLWLKLYIVCTLGEVAIKSVSPLLVVFASNRPSLHHYYITTSCVLIYNDIAMTLYHFPQIDCPIEGQVHQRCQSCPETCDQRATGEVIFCILVCRPGCGCPPGQVIDVENNRCVVEEDCPVTRKSAVLAGRTYPNISQLLFALILQGFSRLSSRIHFGLELKNFSICINITFSSMQQM